MVDERLVIYIKDCMRKGYSLDYIRQMLVNEGWKANQVDEAINFVQAPSPPPPGSPPAQAKQKAPSKKPARPKRPRGVTILAVLGIILSVISLASGVLVLTAGGVLSFLGGTDTALTLLGFLGSFTMIIGIINLAVGLFGFIAYFLLFKMKRSGLIMVILIAITSLGPSVMNFDIISILLTGLILVYLIANRNLFV